MSNLKLAFAMSSSEIVEEEIEIIKNKYGKIPVLTEGIFVYNQDSSYRAEWWAPEEAVNDYNNLATSKYTFTYN